MPDTTRSQAVHSRRQLLAMAGAAVLFPLSSAFAEVQDEVFASPWTKLSNAEVRLMLAGSITVQGRKWRLGGIEIRMGDDEKTYWRSAGDTGVVPQFDFTKSQGVREAIVDFPAPTPFDDGAGGTALGYRGGVVLPIRFQVNPGAPFRLTVGMSFGVCQKNLCLPAETIVSMTDTTGSEDRDAHHKLEVALEHVPVDQAVSPENKFGIVQAGGRRSATGMELVLNVRSGESDRLYFETDGDFTMAAPEILAGGNRRYTLTIKPAKANGPFGRGRVTLVTDSRAIETTLDLDALATKP